MRLVLLSDTHSFHGQVQVPDGDVLVHAGDWCGRSDVHNMLAFCEWFAAQPHPHKVFIAGNHDWPALNHERFLLESYPLDRDDENLHYLRDSGCVIDGVTFYGSPWQPEFCNWAFNLPRGPQLAERWAKIPTGVDVLVTHGPPYGVRDVAPRPGGKREHVGCFDLREAIARVQPRLHVFGHIHNGAGTDEHDWEPGKTLFVNASICTEAYRPTNQPIVVDLVDGVASVVTSEGSTQ